MERHLKKIITPLFTGSLLLAASCNSTTQKEVKVQVHADTVSISAKAFEKNIAGKAVHLFTLKNSSGLKAMITNFGGRLVGLFVPDKAGNPVDVVAGFAAIEGYQKSTEPYFGATIGRYGNRIAKGLFHLDGKSYALFTNNGPNTLHGGKKGYQDVVWDAKQTDGQTLELTYLSKDMEGGFPGNLQVKVTYALTNENALKISYEAVTDKNTVVNLTNHAFFNLNGVQSGSILNHLVKIDADQYTPVDSTLIPTGKIEEVKGTPFDFTQAKTIGKAINTANVQLKYGKGYDHNFVLNPHKTDQAVAVVTGDQTGIEMHVYTDQPGLQFYSGNFMQGKNRMKGQHQDDFRTAFALETQHFPDSPNQPSFPTTILKPGAVYRSVSIYKFSVAK